MSTERARAEWERLLDAFTAAAAADAVPAAWTEPSSPMPPELAERAREVLAKTRARIVATQAEMDAVADRLGALDRQQHADASPVYLDVTG
ncbi:hypothetical protein [Microbacterium sp. GXF7504]